MSSYPLQEALHRFAVVVPASLALVQAWIPWAAIEWNGPGWSLSVEAFFYLTFPFLAPAIWRWSEHHAGLVLTVLWVLSILPAALFLWLDPHPHGWPWKHQDACNWNLALTCTPLLRLPEFLGGALCRLFTTRPLNPAAAARLAWGAAVLLTTALAVRGPLSYELVSNGLLDPLFGALILGIASSPGRGFLANSGLTTLGEASYSLIHSPRPSLALDDIA